MVKSNTEKLLKAKKDWEEAMMWAVKTKERLNLANSDYNYAKDHEQTTLYNYLAQLETLAASGK